MRKVICTFAHGPHHEAMQALTLPALEAYATRHGYALCIWQVEPNGRPLSWEKVPVLAELLTRYDVALWVDADVLIVDGSQDIATAVPAEAAQALAVHTVAGVGDVPNCGVWFVRPPMLPVLRLLDGDSAVKSLRVHGWWEQAALMLRMGYTLEFPCKRKSNTVLWQQTHILGNEWNRHPAANWQGSAYFRHATNGDPSQRLQMLRDWQGVADASRN